MPDLAVLDTPEAAALVLDPIKNRLLAALVAPASAAALAGRVGLNRQTINYHLRALEQHGLVETVEERRWGGLTERLLMATASSYAVSPAALGELGADPSRSNDHQSASYLVALASRIVREVGALWRSARRSDKRLATLSVDTVVRFATPADRAAFTAELGQAIAALAARYHSDAARARPHRLIVVSYPAPSDTSS